MGLAVQEVYAFAGKTVVHCLVLTALIVVGCGAAPADDAKAAREEFFVTDSGLDLRKFADAQTRELLKRIRGNGNRFGADQAARYCRLKKRLDAVQWVVNDLATGRVISRSANAGQLYFGASVSKLFVAAALLDKQQGEFTRDQLRQLVKLIVVSDNVAWKDLQRQVGDDGSNNAGRAAVQAFVERMGYPTIKGFQGWRKRKDGTREHGNELNAMELARFLSDTYNRKYPGADVLWEVMRATRTGSGKIGRFTPSNLYLGGKTGTYSGPNESPDTVHLRTIKARNHAVVLKTESGHFGISVLANTGSSGDVAVLGGGLMREYLGVQPLVECR